MLKLALAALLIGAASAVSAPSPPHSRYCPVLVYEDYNYPPVVYRAVLLRDPSCRPDQVARIRKTSTLNLYRRYQPIRPEKGAWEIRATSDTVPDSALWTLLSWRWQFWDGETWQFAELR